MKTWWWVNDLDEYNQYMADVLSEFQPIFDAHKDRLDEIDKEMSKMQRQGLDMDPPVE